MLAKRDINNKESLTKRVELRSWLSIPSALLWLWLSIPWLVLAKATLRGRIALLAVCLLWLSC